MSFCCFPCGQKGSLPCQNECVLCQPSSIKKTWQLRQQKKIHKFSGLIYWLIHVCMHSFSWPVSPLVIHYRDALVRFLIGFYGDCIWLHDSNSTTYETCTTDRICGIKCREFLRRVHFCIYWWNKAVQDISNLTEPHAIFGIFLHIAGIEDT